MAKQIVLLGSDGRPTEEVVAMLRDVAIVNRYPTLKGYCHDQKIKISEKELKLLAKSAETTLGDQIKYLAFLLYQILQQSGNWGEAGEDQVKLSFCRNVLRIGIHETVTQDHAFRFLLDIDKVLLDLGMQSMSLQTSLSTYKNATLTLFGKIYASQEIEKLNAVLRFLGSDCLVSIGLYGDHRQIIFGRGTQEPIGGFDAITLEEEIWRTPNVIVAMAAVIGGRQIWLRMEAMKTIFYQKWIPVFELGGGQVADIRKSPERNISEGLKRRTLSYYGAKDIAGVKDIESAFVADMKETILYHELGHGLVEHDLLNPDETALAESTKAYGETIFTSLLEFLSDFAPAKFDVKGPIQNMVDISQKDVKRATRMYYMYFSDVWFFDTADSYMYLYSDLMALILIKYIEPDGAVNFERLEADIQFSTSRIEKNKLTMVERIVELLSWSSQDIKAMVLGATFTLRGTDQDYSYVRKLTLQNFRDKKIVIDETDYTFLIRYWGAMLQYCKQFSPETSQKLSAYFADQEKKILAKMLILSAGRKVAEACEYNHRAYIFERLKKMGIVAYKSGPKTTKA